jgi:hypothetical protein
MRPVAILRAIVGFDGFLQLDHGKRLRTNGHAPIARAREVCQRKSFCALMDKAFRALTGRPDTAGRC